MKQDLAKLHHARSKKDFPDLKLEENEYVELAITRSKIILIFIWASAAACYAGLLVGSIFLNSPLASSFAGIAKSYMQMVILILLGVITIAALVATKVHFGNNLYVTNKRLIHHEMTSLFSKSVNVINLTSIEDVSFRQDNIVDYIFKLGTMRMSTVGDETTYTFKFVNTPHDELETITHLVHVEKENAKSKD